MGDFSKEIDKRVKDEVAKMREKDDYEVRIRLYYDEYTFVHILYICYFLTSISAFYMHSWVICQLYWMIKLKN